MEKAKMKPLLKSLLRGLVFAAVLIVTSLLIDFFSSYPFIDILFIEGMFMVIIGGFPLFYILPSGTFMKALRGEDTQSASSVHAKVAETEDIAKRKVPKMKPDTVFVMISFMIGGVICILLDILLVLL